MPPTKARAAPVVSRDEARDTYLRIFGEFALEIYDRGEKHQAPIDNRNLEPVVAAISARLDAANSEQRIVRDWVNGQYEVWQCLQTYDHWSEEQAAEAFDAAWPPDLTEVTLEPDQTLPDARGRACYCGCGATVKSARSLFATGHDAKFAGRLIRSARAGEISGEAAVAEADKVSPRLAAKVQAGVLRKVTRRQAKRNEAPDPITGTVTIGRWAYPARRFPATPGSLGESDVVERNTKRDGSGDWVTSDKVYDHFRGVFVPDQEG